jgi:hypothetical protein
MARDLAATWELLTAVTRARQQLASARPLIWEKARLPTSEHTLIIKASAAGERWSHTNNGSDQVVMRVSLETLLKDGRRLASCAESVDSAARSLLDATMKLDFGEIDE